MYLRTTQRKNSDGSIVRYIQLAHNRRVEGGTQAEVLVNLGREDRLDREGLRRLVASINRYLGEPDDHDGAGDVLVEVGDALTVVGSRPMGTAWLPQHVERVHETSDLHPCHSPDKSPQRVVN